MIEWLYALVMFLVPVSGAVAAVVSKGLVDNYGVPWPLLVPLLLSVALWSLTSEEAADMRYVGGLASLLRSRLGQRRIDEWARALWHYWRVAAGPRLKERCSAQLVKLRRHIWEGARYCHPYLARTACCAVFLIASVRRRRGGISATRTTN